VVAGITPTAKIAQNTFESTSTVPETTKDVLAEDATTTARRTGGGPRVGALVGPEDGCPEGTLVGAEEGLVMVGATVGNAVKLAWVGPGVGAGVGASEGVAVTITVGGAVGVAVGTRVGLTVGVALGTGVGAGEGTAVGWELGWVVGTPVGTAEG